MEDSCRLFIDGNLLLLSQLGLGLGCGGLPLLSQLGLELGVSGLLLLLLLL